VYTRKKRRRIRKEEERKEEDFREGKKKISGRPVYGLVFLGSR
jgi:hypothetical protein